MTKALIPGTFDPITNGHLDVITRAAVLFDEIVVGVASSQKKRPLFDIDERTRLVCEAVKDLPNVTVMPFDDLLVHFAREIGVDVVVKGLRAITDFEYEFQMTSANYHMAPEIETMFVMSPPEYMYLSSSMVREIASFHGDISALVPVDAAKALTERFS